jgi:hypothetical protein
MADCGKGLTTRSDFVLNIYQLWCSGWTFPTAANKKLSVHTPFLLVTADFDARYVLHCCMWAPQS